MSKTVSKTFLDGLTACPVCDGPLVVTLTGEGEGGPGRDVVCPGGCCGLSVRHGDSLSPEGSVYAHSRVGSRDWFQWPGSPPHEHARVALFEPRRQAADDRANREAAARLREPERRAFEDAVTRDPYDRATRLVYADWLDERGEDDAAAEQRRWTPEVQRAREHLARCALGCETSPDDLVRRAVKALEDGGGLHLSNDIPAAMYDRRAFWEAVGLVTGRAVELDEEDRPPRISCSC